jgi:hypothetical protein
MISERTRNDATQKKETVMTNTHTLATFRAPIEVAVQRPLYDAIASLRSQATIFASRLFANFQHRRMMKRFERFSDYDLQDVGFERDWDGSIRPIVG